MKTEFKRKHFDDFLEFKKFEKNEKAERPPIKNVDILQKTMKIEARLIVPLIAIATAAITTVIAASTAKSAIKTIQTILNEDA